MIVAGRSGLFDACRRPLECECAIARVGRRRISLDGGNRGVVRCGRNVARLWSLISQDGGQYRISVFGNRILAGHDHEFCSLSI
jgi:hypothetical protein